MCPGAEYLYACDRKWWEVHLPAVNETFSGERYTQYRDEKEKQFADENGIIALKGINEKGLGRDRLHFNSNSGAQAINLAYLKGATQIVLLGYDMQQTGGKAHWFGSHPPTLHNGNYSAYVQSFTRLAEDLAAEGVDVVNCTRETALHQFRQAELGDIL